MIITPIAAPRYWMVVLGAGLYAGLAFLLFVGDSMPISYVRPEWSGALGVTLGSALSGLLFLVVGTAIYWAKRVLLYAMGRRRLKVLSNID